MRVDEAVIVFIIGTLLLTLFALSLIVFMIIHKRRQQKNLTEKMELQHRYETQLLQTRLEVQEQSFKYFSEEIHDNVGQVLSVARLYVHQLGEQCSSNEQQELAQKSKELISKALGDLRSISHTLNSDFVTRVGLKEAIEKELQYVSGAKSIACSLTTEGDEYSLDNEQELVAFRIVQEAIANAIKHAGARRLQLQLQYNPGELIITITDDGKGFDAASAGDAKSLGLHNMRTRAAMLSGTLHIHSEKGKGTTITLTIQPQQQ